MRSYQVIAVIVASIALLWIGSGFVFPSHGSNDIEINEETDETLTQVRIRKIKPQNYTDDVVVTGRSQASKRVTIKAETNGLVKEILKEEGQTVGTEDVLARLEIRDRQSRVEEAKERVNQRRIEYNAARRLAGEGFNSKVRLAQSLADLENAKAILKDVESALEKTTIIAPFEGIIAEQQVEAGDYLALGDPIFTLVDLDPVEFVGFVSERQINSVDTDDMAVIELLDRHKDEYIYGRVTYIAPAANEDTRTFRVIISAANSDLKLKEGLTAKLRIPAEEKQAYKISPSILSLDDEGVIGVKIVDAQDIVRFIPVTILADTIEATWVETEESTDTLKFITVGQEFVGTGQKVTPVPAKGNGLL